ncbi:ABC multidrug transporter, partial [Phlyctema vagabunda]
KDGTVAQQGNYAQLQSTDGYVRDLALEQVVKAKVVDHETIDVDAQVPPDSTAVREDSEALDLKRQTGDMSLYGFYFKSVSAGTALFWLGLAILYTGLSKIPQVWIRLWAEQGMNNNSSYYFGSYFALSFSCVLASTFSVSFFMLVIVPKSAQSLHWLFLESVMMAPLWFFTTTDSGVTLNRFAQDMTLLDNRLPVAAYHTVYDILFTLLSTALIAAGAQYVAAVIPFSMVALYLLARYYLRTSRQMRYLDLEAKTPLFTLFTETIDGLATIRAFGWRRSLMEENLRLLDQSQKPYYLLFCIQRWLTVVLDLFIATIAIILVAFAVEFRHTTSQGAIGVALINILSLNTELSELVNNWADLETSLGAIARLRSFLQDTPKEDGPERDQPVPETWPSKGLIELRDVSAAYRSGDSPVLQNVSLTIEPGQKIGVCGRTGSGKSSLILTLLRLLEVESGSVFIDGVDISTLSRDTIRSRIITLPQDPIQLAGTVRENLCPGAIHVTGGAGEDDARLVSALRKVSIWETVHERGGLDAEFSKIALSHGQQQLFCLARAMLLVGREEKKIVLLDEPTSSVDRDTDAAVLQVVRDEFKHCTVVAVAHRLDSIVGCQAVVCMDAGRVVEVGEPRVLLAQEGSRFRMLWDARHG